MKTSLHRRRHRLSLMPGKPRWKSYASRRECRFPCGERSQSRDVRYLDRGDVPTGEVARSTQGDPNAADLAPVREPIDQSIDFGSCRWKDITYLTLKTSDL